MKIIRIVSFFTVLVVPVSLFAQGGGTSSASTTSISTDFGDSYTVENVSEAAIGTFIGGGRSTVGFVGNVEIYNTGSTRSSSSTSRTNTATMPRSISSAVQRRPTTAVTRTTQAGLNNQSIRSISSIDFDFTVPAQWRQPAMVETDLNRVNGVQDSRITFTSTPLGTTVVLTGTVSSDRQRKVAQQLILLEPGVSRVENLLEIR